MKYFFSQICHLFSSFQRFVLWYFNYELTIFHEPLATDNGSGPDNLQFTHCVNRCLILHTFAVQISRSMTDKVCVYGRTVIYCPSMPLPRRKYLQITKRMSVICQNICNRKFTVHAFISIKDKHVKVLNSIIYFAFS